MEAPKSEIVICHARMLQPGELLSIGGFNFLPTERDRFPDPAWRPRVICCNQNDHDIAAVLELSPDKFGRHKLHWRSAGLNCLLSFRAVGRDRATIAAAKHMEHLLNSGFRGEKIKGGVLQTTARQEHAPAVKSAKTGAPTDG